MKKTVYLSVLTCFFVLLGCGGKSTTQKVADADALQGAKVLAAARQACLKGQYDAARDSIMALRSQYPMALDAREQAILLLDSVEQFAAQDSLDALEQTKDENPVYADEHERLSMKVEFFKRKLELDKKK